MGKEDNDVDEVGAGAEGDDVLPDESGGSGLGATDGTSSVVKRQAALDNVADNDDDGGGGEAMAAAATAE